MALPTASTLGFTMYSGKVACICQSQWFYWYRKLAKLKGLGDVTIWQLVGALTASSGTHSGGGAADWAGISRALAMLAREMGAPATWPRDWAGNRHTHSVLSACIHNRPASYQVTAQFLGFNGLGYLGMGGRDTLPRPSKYRTWREGILWAKAEIARITGERITVPTPPSKEDDPMADITVKHPLTGKQVPIADALWSMWTYILEARDDPDETARKVWEQTVTRGGGQISVKQELADAKTIALQSKAVLSSVAASLTAVKAGVEALPDEADADELKTKADALASALADLIDLADGDPT